MNSVRLNLANYKKLGYLGGKLDAYYAIMNKYQLQNNTVLHDEIKKPENYKELIHLAILFEELKSNIRTIFFVYNGALRSEVLDKLQEIGCFGGDRLAFF